jgi:hypothetical protein
MANRLNAPNQFEALSPPWILSQLDTNFTQNQAAWNDSSLGFVNGIPVDTGSANNYLVTVPFGSPSAYQDGMTVPFIPANTNTGASTITVSPLGSVAILNPAGIALNGGEIAANRALMLVYKSAAPVGFRIIGPCATTSVLNNPGNTTVECAGYTSVHVQVSFTISTSTSLALAHLAPGTTVTVQFVNAFGSPNSYAITATNPAGTAIAQVNAQFPASTTGAASVDLTAAQSLNNGNRITFVGVAGISTLLFSV